MPPQPKPALQLFVDRLRRSSRLTDDEADALLALRGNTSVARANVDIVSPGEVTDHACLVLDGLAGRFGMVVDGRRQITALYIAGDMCDLHSLVAPEAGWAIQALSPTAILRVPHRQLMELAGRFPNLAMAFWRDCSVDASILSQWVVNVGRRDARSSLAHLLCEMGLRLEQVGLGTRTRFRLAATQTQIGDALGLTPVHVNRTMKVLKDEGLVTIRSQEVQIPDWSALAALGDFDEDYLHACARNQRGASHAAPVPPGGSRGFEQAEVN